MHQLGNQSSYDAVPKCAILLGNQPKIDQQSLGGYARASGYTKHISQTARRGYVEGIGALGSQGITGVADGRFGTFAWLPAALLSNNILGGNTIMEFKRFKRQDGETIYIKVSEGEDEEISIDKDRDYSSVVITINQEVIRVNYTIEIPKGFDNHRKARISEEAGKIILAIISEAYIEARTSIGHDFRAVGGTIPHTVIDVKYSSTLCYSEDGRLEWEFGLASHGKIKDYSKSCDALMCIGSKPGGGIDVFLIPSKEVKSKSKITIPVSWRKSKYRKYHVPLEISTTELEKLLQEEQGDPHEGA